MSLRTDKINELIRQKLSEIIRKDIELPDNTLATVTKVETSPDIKYCKVFVSILPESNRGTSLEILRKNSHYLHKALQKQMFTKFTPNLKFLVDEQEIFATEIDKLLDEVNKA